MAKVDALPDAEALVSYELRTQLSARVYSSIPRTPVFPFILVKRIGGIPTVRERLDRANIQLEVWGTSGTSKSTIRDLADSARVKLHAMEGKVMTTGAGYPVNGTCTGVTDTLGLAWLPDPVTDADRYIFAVYVYLHA
jgi:hypothetical protein